MLACGLEMMSRVPLGAAMKGGSPIPKSYLEHYALSSQFGGAEMIGNEYGITRAGRRSLRPAQPGARRARVGREALRARSDSDRRARARPRGQADRRRGARGARRGPAQDLAREARDAPPVPGQNLHTAGTSSQVSDGAAAVILASADGVKRLGIKPRARIVDSRARRLRSRHDAEGPDPRDQEGARALGPQDRGHVDLRGERGVRVGRAGLDEGSASRSRSA